MSGELTDKTFCVVTHRTGRYYVNEQRARNIQTLINDPNAPRLIEIDGNYVAVIDIAGVVSASQLQDMDRMKRGDWQCKYGYWHERNNTCAHHLMPRKKQE